MGYTNSSLIDCIKKSPNHSGRRTHSIDRITPHCVVGQLSASAIGACFPKGRNASCNYGIGKDGKVCLIVDEANRSWCTSSNANDQRAVTIECASDMSEPYTMNNAVYEKLIVLCVDICRRNGKKKLLWFADKQKSLNYEPKNDEMVLTVHRWFANKSCPGNWLYSRLGDVANKVTAQLGGSSKPSTPTTGDKKLYRVQVGAYSKKENAEVQLKKVKAAGFDAFITEVDGLYKIQVGAYAVKDNAYNQLKNITGKGFDAFITTSGKVAGTSVKPKKSNAEIAREIYNGTCSDSRWSTWGCGAEREERLKVAGYDPAAVQVEVNKLF